MFLSSVTRPDITYCVSYLSRFLNCFDESHYNAAKRILRYVIDTPNHGMKYDGRHINELLITGYCDADYAADINTRRSTTGYIFVMSEGPISWCSQRQRMVTVSTTESEYVSASEASKEAS